MADDLTLEIVTPEKMTFSGKVEEVTIPGTEGEFGVLRGHEAFLSSVDIGELNFVKGSKKIYYSVNNGYAEVTANKVTILIETAERSDAIDKDRALKAKDNAECPPRADSQGRCRIRNSARRIGTGDNAYKCC